MSTGALALGVQGEAETVPSSGELLEGVWDLGVLGAGGGLRECIR